MKDRMDVLSCEYLCDSIGEGFHLILTGKIVNEDTDLYLIEKPEDTFKYTMNIK